MGWGPFEVAASADRRPLGGSRPPPEPGRMEGQALGVLELSPGFVSRRPQQAPLGHRWHCCLDLRTPKARRRHGCSRPPPLGPARGLAVCLGIRPLEGGRADRSRLPLLPSTPTPNPPALLHPEAAPGSYRSERRRQRHWSGQWSWRQRRDAECVWGRGEGRGVGARGEGLRPRLRRAPRSTPSPGGRPGSQARAPRLGQAPRLPSRGDHPGTQRSTLAPSRRPPAPLPRPGAASACPAGPCPSPRTPSGDPGARPEEQGAAGR